MFGGVMGTVLTGTSLSLLSFGVGVDWKVDDTERETVRRLLAYLEDRRVLFKPNYGDRRHV
jgi:hypothetical protein